MVRMDQERLNKRVVGRIHEYKSVGGYVKQTREETEKLKIRKKIKRNKSRFLWKTEGYGVIEGKEAKARRNNEKILG